MEDKSFLEKYGKWLIVASGLLVFISFLFPLVNYHPVAYDPVSWEFAEAGSRIKANFLTYMASWPIIVLYSIIIIAVLMALLAVKFKKLLNISMLLFMVGGVMFLLSNYLFSYQLGLAAFKEYAAEVGDEYKFWFIQSYINMADSRLEAGAIIASIMSFVTVLVMFAVMYRGEKVTVRELTEMGILIAAAVALDIIFHFIPNLPGQVGSVSIATLPLMIIALRHGPVKGFFASSIVFGLITCVTDGYGLWLYPLDYFVAFSGVAIIGLFKDKIMVKDGAKYVVQIILIFAACLASGIMRLVGSGASSILNYNYTLEAAFIANSLYALVSALLCAGALVALLKPLQLINEKFPIKKSDIE